MDSTQLKVPSVQDHALDRVVLSVDHRGGHCEAARSDETRNQRTRHGAFRRARQRDRGLAVEAVVQGAAWLDEETLQTRPPPEDRRRLFAEGQEREDRGLESRRLARVVRPAAIRVARGHQRVAHLSDRVHAVYRVPRVERVGRVPQVCQVDLVQQVQAPVTTVTRILVR